LSVHATASTLAAEGLLDRVRALAPAIAAAALEAERLRKPVDSVMRELEATGVFRAYVPRRFGGYEIDIDTFVDVGLTIGAACASTGWVTTFCMEHNWLLAHFAPEAQEHIFGAQPYVLAPGSISPNGRANPVDGGYLLDGRWSWGTGVMHADWVILNGVIPQADGRIEARLFALPRAQVTVEDVWFAAGLCGTGSNDIVAHEVFVPTVLSQDLAPMRNGQSPGARWHDCATFRYPMIPFLALTATTPLVGAAGAAVDLFERRLAERVLYGAAEKQSQSVASQVRLGHARARRDALEGELRRIARAIAGWGDSHDPCPQRERARLRLGLAHVVEGAKALVDSVMQASGASAQLSRHPLQRIQRDLHTGASHSIFDLDVAGELYGKILLGQDAKGLL
jgi:3-hydroxy-9,10-secoandrosta-1,3,5(10)-triene-9,17-dione monooxygenase